MVNKIQNICKHLGGPQSFGFKPPFHRGANLPAFLNQCFCVAENGQQSSDGGRCAILHLPPAQDLVKDLAGVPELDECLLIKGLAIT